MRNHRESLIAARKLLNENVSNLWAVVISYYSMFYIANAILYESGYKVGSKVAHKVTADALIAFVRKRLKDALIEDYQVATEEALALSDNLLQNYDHERLKRSVFQYETTEEIKRTKAETSLARAEEFSKEIEKML
ncbi:MAG TPA: HEPN domain-containing protein [Candidatus Nanoarchaeia archaeon]|nr:HEPN domain-containing protein [Candidatus Nanoarchaeia archaeon]